MGQEVKGFSGNLGYRLHPETNAQRCISL